MRKLFLILFLLIVSIIANAQARTVFGLVFGKTYTENDLRSIINSNSDGQYEVTTWSDRTASIQGLLEEVKVSNLSMAADLFSPITVMVYPVRSMKGRPAYMISLSTDKELQSVASFYDETCGDPFLVYHHLADSLKSIYPTESIQDGIGLQCNNNEGISIVLKKEDKYVYLSFTDNSYIEEAFNSILPPIQDTFMSLTLGNRYSVERVKSVLDTRGAFLNSTRNATGTEVSFTKIAYAGKIWDYGSIMLTIDGEFAQFSVYDSLNDYYDERKDARDTYDRYKEILDKKYSSAIYPSIEDDGTSVTAFYRGGNGISLMIYNKRDKTAGGSYRRFVGIEYSHIGIIRGLMDSRENEL